MGIDLPSEYVHLSHAATACNCHFRVPVVQLRSYMVLSCHLVSIPFLILHLLVIIPSTLLSGTRTFEIVFAIRALRRTTHWTVALHGFVFYQGPEIIDPILHGIVHRQDGGGMH